MRFSFLLITYNQERYIADALKSALSQDYDELEIIVSDDHSSDRTFEIAQEIAAEYHGPFKIILNRNPQNIGIGCNFYKAYTLSHGEWLFMAAGDDISYPDRCSYVRAVIDKNPDVLAIGAIRDVIDGDNRHLGYSLWHEIIHGASAVWHRRLFSEFPPIEPGNMSEDMVLFFRVFLLNGKAINLFRPLIYYRIDGHSVSNAGANNVIDFKRKLLKKGLNYEKILHNNYSDLEYRKEALCESDYICFLSILENESRKNERRIGQLRFFLDTVNLPFCKRFRSLWNRKDVSLKQKILIEIMALTGLLYHKIVFRSSVGEMSNLTAKYKEFPAQIISKNDVFEKQSIVL